MMLLSAPTLRQKHGTCAMQVTKDGIESQQSSMAAWLLDLARLSAFRQ